MTTPTQTTQHVTATDLEAVVAGMKTALGEELAKCHKRIAELEATPAPLETAVAIDRKTHRFGAPAAADGYKSMRAALTERDAHKGAGYDFAAIALASGLAAHYGRKGDPRSVAAQLALLGDQHLADQWSDWSKSDDFRRYKQITTDNVGSGGDLIAPQYGAEMIPLLIAATVLGRTGVRQQSVSSMEFILGETANGFNFQWFGEATPPAYSQPSTGQRTWRARGLGATTALSMQFVEQEFATAVAYWRDLFVAQFALAMDSTLLRGAPAPFAPTGIRWKIDAANQLLQTGTSLANIITDIYRLAGAVEDSNTPFAANLAWIQATRTRRSIAQLRDGVGGFVFPTMESMTAPTLLGRPVYTTTYIPTNLGGGGNQTEWYAIVPQEVMIAMLRQFTVKSSPDVAFTDANGNLVSAWERNLLAIRGEGWCDIQLMHPRAAAVITDSTI